MGKRINPATVGAFVLGAVGLILAAVVVFGSGNLFRKSHEFVIYFAGDINGLRVGAPVKFKGVEVGSVTDVLLNLNIDAQPVAHDFAAIRIPVIIALDEHKIIGRGAVTDFSKPENLKRAIAVGLRGQLATESLLTGLLYIDLDMHPGTQPKLYLPPHSEYEEIPTLPNPYEEAQTAATRLIRQLDKVQLDKLVNTATDTLNAYKELAESDQLKQAIASINHGGESIDEAALSLRKLTDNLNRTIVPLGPQMQASVRSADATLKQAQATLNTLNMELRPDSPLVYQTSQTLSDISDAARSVRHLADYLDRNPDAIIRGRDFQKVRK